MVKVEGWIARRGEEVAHRAADGLMARPMHPGLHVGDQFVVVGALGEEIRDVAVGQKAPGERGIEISFDATRVVVESRPAPYRRAQRG